MRQIIGGKIYDTEKAEKLATNEFSDGNNRLQHGRATTLYKTNKGNFFAHHETCWQDDNDNIEQLTIAKAREYFEDLGGNPANWPTEFGEPEEA
jgi:hypothetical protein